MCFLVFPGGLSGERTHLPTQEIQVRSLGWEDPLEKEMATHSSFLAWETHGKRSLVGYSPWVTNSQAWLSTWHLHFHRADGLPWWLSGKESPCQCRRRRRCRRQGFAPWVGKIFRKRKWQPTPEFLPGKSQGQRSMVGYRTQGCKESDTAQETQQERCVLHSLPKLPHWGCWHFSWLPPSPTFWSAPSNFSNKPLYLLTFHFQGGHKFKKCFIGQMWICVPQFNRQQGDQISQS